MGEFPVVTDGEVDGKMSLVQVVDAESIRAMAAAFDAAKGCLLDYEHNSHNPVVPDSSAAAWIVAVEARADGLWGLPRWTSKGKADVEGGVFRYLSPTFLFADCEDLGGGRVRPRRLDDAGLTNVPNMPITPISNRKNFLQNTTQTHTPIMDYKSELTKLLGLAADTADELIAEAVATVQAEKEAAEAKLKDTEAKLTATEEEANAAALDEAGVTDPEERKDWQKLLNADRASARKLLRNRKTRTTPPAAPPAMHNRATAAPPRVESTVSPGERAALQNREVEKIRMANRCTFEAAWNMARREKPELFVEGD
jgi:phage I-like protein